MSVGAVSWRRNQANDSVYTLHSSRFTAPTKRIESEAREQLRMRRGTAQWMAVSKSGEGEKKKSKYTRMIRRLTQHVELLFGSD